VDSPSKAAIASLMHYHCLMKKRERERNGKKEKRVKKWNFPKGLKRKELKSGKQAVFLLDLCLTWRKFIPSHTNYNLGGYLGINVGYRMG